MNRIILSFLLIVFVSFTTRAQSDTCTSWSQDDSLMLRYFNGSISARNLIISKYSPANICSDSVGLICLFGNQLRYYTPIGWVTLASSSSSVTSVFGRSGDVVADSGDYAYSQISGKPNLGVYMKYTDSPAMLAPYLRKADSSIFATPYRVDTGVKNTRTWANLNFQPTLSFTPENVANKAAGFGTLNNTLYPTTQAVSNYVNSQGFITLGSLSAASPINYNNSTGAFSLGTVPISKGGTGQVTAQAALNALLPAQTNGFYLTTDGTNSYFTALTFVGGISCTDGSLNIAPTFGNVFASLNTANANTWQAAQTYSVPSVYSSLTANGGVIYNNGSGQMQQTAAGTAHQVLHAGASPSWGLVDLTADVTGLLPDANISSAAIWNAKGSVSSITAGAGLNGGTITTTGTISLPVLISAATYGSSNTIPVITMDAYGRLTSITTPTVTPAITNVTGITGTPSSNSFLRGDYTWSPLQTSNLPTTGTAGTYGDATHVPVYTVDAYGRITATTNTLITGAAPTGSAGGDLTGSYPNPSVAGTVVKSVVLNTPNVIFGTPVNYTTSSNTATGTLSLNTQSAYTVFGNNTGSSSTPTFFNPTLASALFNNQGTITTVLHGSGSGAPSWGSVVLTTDVSGTLPIGSGGTGSASFTTGSIPYSNGTILTQDNNNLYWNATTHSLSVSTNGDFSGTNAVNIFGQYDAFQLNSKHPYLTDSVNMAGVSVSTSRGTSLAPLANLGNDTIGNYGYWCLTSPFAGGTTYKEVAMFTGMVLGSSSNLGGQIHTYICPDNSNVWVDMFRFYSTGAKTLTQVEGTSDSTVATTNFVVTCQQLTDTMTIVAVSSGTITPTIKVASTKSDYFYLDTLETGNVYLQTPANSPALEQLYEIPIYTSSAKNISFHAIYVPTDNNPLPTVTKAGKTMILVFVYMYNHNATTTSSKSMVLRSIDYY